MQTTLQRWHNTGARLLRHIHRYTQKTNSAGSFPGLLVLAIHCALFAIAFRTIFAEGAIIFSDLDFGFRTENYLERITDIWNDHWGTSTMFNSSRLYIVAPFYLLSAIFGHPTGLFQKLLLWGLFMLSAVGMSWMSFTISQRLREKGVVNLRRSFLIGASVLAGVVYTYNPWFLVRIQHVYLLVGYALLPIAITSVYLATQIIHNRSTLRTKKQKANADVQSLHLLIIAACSWAIGSGSVHYFLYFGLILGSWYGIACLRELYRREWKALLRNCIQGGTLVGIVILMNAYWLFPQISINVAGDVTPTNVNTLDLLAMLSRFATLNNVLYGISYWWGFFSIESLPIRFWIGGGILLSLTLVSICTAAKKNALLLFCLLWYILCIIIALGPKGPSTGIYLHILYDTPVSGSLGFLFRDPNKFIGPQFVFFSALLSTGLVVVLSELRRMATHTHLYSWFQKILSAGIPIICILVAWGAFAYARPVQKIYLEHYLSPTRQPEAYAMAQRHFAEEYPEHAVWISTPRYEDVVSPEAEFAIASWNDGTPAKPTSSTDIWSLPLRTYHPLEGAYNNVKHMYRFFEESLQEKNTDRLPSIASNLGASLLMHHTDLAMREEHATEDGWNQQHFAEEPVDIDFLSIANLNQESTIGRTISRLLFSSRNVQYLDTYSLDAHINLDDTAPLFYEQLRIDDFANIAKPGDLIDEDRLLNLVLSTADEGYSMPLMNMTKRGDPFTGWAVSTTAHGDWMWNAKLAGMHNAHAEFDPGSGVLFTHAPAAINHLPFNDSLGGEHLLTINDVINDPHFFLNHNPERISLLSEPTSRYDRLPSIKATVAHGGSDIWRVVSSKPIEAHPLRGYRYDMTLSSIQSGKLHAKVIYRNEEGKEVGVSYSAAPKHADTFEALKFYGLFITPPDTASIEFQLWSLEDPEEQSYWWMHDFNLFSLHEKTVPNTASTPLTIETPGIHRLFVKVLRGDHSGVIDLGIGDVSLTVNTHEPGTDGFSWIDAGHYVLEEGDATLNVTSRHGFNAIVDIMLIPSDAFDTHEDAILHSAQKLRQHIVLEGEYDFSMESKPPTIRTAYTDLSRGHALYVDDDTLTRDIDIFADGNYALDVYIDPQSIERNPLISAVLTEADSGRALMNIRNILLYTSEQNPGHIVLPPYFLKAGKHTLSFSLQDRSDSLLDTTQFSTSDSSTIDEGMIPENESWFCNVHETFADHHATIRPSSQQLFMRIAQGYSCRWGIATSKSVDVEPGQEWYLSFDLRNRGVHLRHAKVTFLNPHGKHVGTRYITKIQDDSSDDWKRYRDTFTVPENAYGMQVQFWGRKHPDGPASLSVRDLQLKPYRSLPNIDFVTLRMTESDTKQIGSTGLEGEGFGMERTIIVPPVGEHTSVRALQMYETYQPLWKMAAESDTIRAYPLYGMLNGFLLSGDDHKEEYTYTLEPHITSFRIGSIFTVVGISLLGGLVIRRKMLKKNT